MLNVSLFYMQFMLLAYAFNIYSSKCINECNKRNASDKRGIGKQKKM
jgi:hypothetical protein